jgi:phosphoribosyl-ATP pyrophosphohydrolase
LLRFSHAGGFEMAKLKATIELTLEYGHSNNRPSESYQLKQLTEGLNKILEKAAEEGSEKNKLAHWYLTAIRVD